MKRKITVGLSAVLLSCVCTAKAQEEVPCLIFTGASDSQYCVDLSKLNRITFGDDGMTVSSSTDSHTPEVTLLYALYNHIEIGDATPTDVSGIGIIKTDGDSKLIYINNEKSLRLESPYSKPYSIGIFSLNGTLIATSTMTAGQSLSLEALSSGTYIAVATDGKSQISLKFKL